MRRFPAVSGATTERLNSTPQETFMTASRSEPLRRKTDDYSLATGP
jgi:hypothetical protein